MNSYVSAMFPSVSARFWNGVKRDNDLNLLFTAYAYNDCDSAARALRDELLRVCEDCLSQMMLDDIIENLRMNIINIEVAAAGMLEPDEEQAQWDAWERHDLQDDLDAQMDFYKNYH